MHTGFLHRWIRENNKGLHCKGFDVMFKCMRKDSHRQKVCMLGSLSNPHNIMSFPLQMTHQFSL